jgi:hypothetical protein
MVCGRSHDTYPPRRSSNHGEEAEDQARIDAARLGVVDLDCQYFCGGYNGKVEAGRFGGEEEEREGGEEALKCEQGLQGRAPTLRTHEHEVRVSADANENPCASDHFDCSQALQIERGWSQLGHNYEKHSSSPKSEVLWQNCGNASTFEATHRSISNHRGIDDRRPHSRTTRSASSHPKYPSSSQRIASSPHRCLYPPPNPLSLSVPDTHLHPASNIH